MIQHAESPAEFLGAILALRSAYLFSVTSWIRTPIHNKDVGGLPTSKHLEGMAVDVVLDPSESEKEFIETASAFGLFPVREHGWVHVQALPHGVSLPSEPFPLSRPALPSAEHELAGAGVDRQGQAEPATAPEGGQAQGGVPLSGGASAPQSTEKA